MLSLTIPNEWTQREINVTLIGCGGTGSLMLSELNNLSGIMIRLGGQGLNVTAFDGSFVSDANVYRQTFHAIDQGHNKAAVLINRLNQWQGTHWTAIPEHFDHTHSDILSKTDLLITAVDLPSVRYAISCCIKSKSTNSHAMWLDLGNGDTSGQVYLGRLNSHNTKENFIPSPAELFGSQWLELMKTEVDVHSCSSEEAISKQSFGINGMLARSASSMLLFPLLRNGSIDNNGLFIDLSTMTINPMPIDPIQWQIYGYVSPLAPPLSA